MIGLGEFQKRDIFPALLFYFDVATTELGRDNIVVSPVYDNLCGLGDRQLRRVCFTVVIGNFVRLSSQELHHGVGTEMEFEGMLKIENPGEREHSFQRRLVGGETKCKLAAGGVSHYGDAASVQVEAMRDLREKAVTVGNVFKRAGPAAARIADAPIFHVPGGASFASQRGTQMASVQEVILSAPESSVDIHNYRKRGGLFSIGEAKIAKLIPVVPIGKPLGCGWRSKSQDIFGHGNACRF